MLNLIRYRKKKGDNFKYILPVKYSYIKEKKGKYINLIHMP